MSDDKTTVLEEPRDDDEYDEDYRGPGRTIAIAAVIAIVVGVAGYFAGHASAGSGPSTLAEAVQQAQDGKLACGDTGSAAPATAQGGAQGGAPEGAGGPPGGGGGQFLVRAICDRGANGGAGGTGGGQNGQRGGFGGRGGLAGGFGGVVGQVQSVSGDTLTLTGRQGTVKVKLSSSTTVRKSATGSLGDVKPGATVTVAGTGQNNENPATSITIVPSNQ